jgi:hypothetical protein
LPDRRPVTGKRATTRRAGARPGPVAGRGTTIRARRWLVLFAALLAFSWQSVVAAGHVHFDSEAAPAAAFVKQNGHKQPAHPGAPSDSPANCPICRGLAHSYHYLPPAPIVFEAPAPVVGAVHVPASIVSAPAPRSHRWRSRAPPLPLQA